MDSHSDYSSSSSLDIFTKNSIQLQGSQRLVFTKLRLKLSRYLERFFHFLCCFSAMLTFILFSYISANIADSLKGFCPSEQFSIWLPSVYFWGIATILIYFYKRSLFVNFVVAHTILLLTSILFLENRIIQFQLFDLSEEALDFYEKFPNKLVAYGECLTSLKLALGLVDLSFLLNLLLVILMFFTHGYKVVYIRMRNSFRLISSVFRGICTRGRYEVYEVTI